MCLARINARVDILSVVLNHKKAQDLSAVCESRIWRTRSTGAFGMSLINPTPASGSERLHFLTDGANEAPPPTHHTHSVLPVYQAQYTSAIEANEGLWPKQSFG
jgi:hypothetical protein